ncbi:NucA/NucB deoxyribonuclease domain-containing protein [Streptomyces sp. NPDC004393]
MRVGGTVQGSVTFTDRTATQGKTKAATNSRQEALGSAAPASLRRPALPLRQRDRRPGHRKAACPPSCPRPADQSCDEYPLARSDQGASLSTQPDWGRAWVPAGEQHAQGELITAFWKSDRVLNGDPFWVAV